MKKYFSDKHNNKMRNYEDKLNQLENEKVGKFSYIKKIKNKNEIKKITKEREQYLKTRKSLPLILFIVTITFIGLISMILFPEFFDDQINPELDPNTLQSENDKSGNNSNNEQDVTKNDEIDKEISDKEIEELLPTFNNQVYSVVASSLGDAPYTLNFLTPKGEKIDNDSLTDIFFISDSKLNKTDETIDITLYSKGAYLSREYEERIRLNGRIVEFGEYEQDNNLNNGKERMRWVVLKNENGKSLLLNLYIIERLQFSDAGIGELIPWKDSDLRNFLNGEFLEQNFSDIEISSIIPYEGFADGHYSKDRVFILSKDEMEMFFENANQKNLP